MTVKSIEINEGHEQLKDILALVEDGVEIILAKNNIPMAKLVPIKNVKTSKRIPGIHRGSVWVSKDFDQHLDEAFWAGGDEIHF